MSIERDIGRLEAELKALKATVERMEPKLDAAVGFIISTKATKRTIIALGSLAGTIGAGAVTAAVSLLNHLKH